MSGWFKRASDLAEIGDLMVALERQSKDVMRLAREIRSVEAGHMFQLKENLRAKISEFEAVVALMDNRLAYLPADKRDLVKNKISDLEALVLTKSVQSYSTFCARAQDSGAVPLWAREVFGRDLGAMEKARSQLTEPRFSGRIAPREFDAIERIKGVLLGLIEKAPRIPDFGMVAPAPAPGD